MDEVLEKAKSHLGRGSKQEADTPLAASPEAIPPNCLLNSSRTTNNSTASGTSATTNTAATSYTAATSVEEAVLETTVSRLDADVEETADGQLGVNQEAINLPEVINPQEEINPQQGIQTTLTSPCYRLHNVSGDLYVSLTYTKDTVPALFRHQIVDARTLEVDIRQALAMGLRGRSNVDSSFTIAPRLSGHLTRGTQQITLYPTVWAQFQSREACEIISHAIRTKLISTGGINIELHDSLRWMRGKPSVPIHGLDLTGGFNFGDGHRLHVHVEDLGEFGSACGLVCCTTISHNGVAVDQWLSRQGGLLELSGNATWAVSTAHGMLDYLLMTEETGKGPLSSEPTTKDAASSAQGKDKGIHISEPETTLLGQVDTASIAAWREVSTALALDFTQLAVPPKRAAGQWSFKVSEQAHDFALYDTGRLNLANSYSHGYDQLLVTETLQDNSIPSFLVVSENAHVLPGQSTAKGVPRSQQVASGPTPPENVKVLLGRSTVAAEVLPGFCSLHIGDIKFQTMQLILENPLAPGTSGSWVVYGKALCGVIIAGYDVEPIAHMITAQQLFDDIQSALPDSAPVRLPNTSTATSFFDIARSIQSLGTGTNIGPRSTRTQTPAGDFGSRQTDVQDPSTAEQRKLYLAPASGSDAVVKLPPERGTDDPDARNKDSRTSLLQALFYMEILLKLTLTGYL
ncbi:hypothetical protein GQ53DRAFT_765200 [Thozetella sp. PMI_491]|nr:hypothetical protein GQ53DRAFT_765200 [Thozetella sp. PMI_491]